jgi:hypothetical protein
MPHRIRRQRWCARVRSQEDGLALRKRLRDDLEDVLQPALDHAFSAAAPQDATLYIDRLEVPVRIRHADELATVLPARIQEALRAALDARGGAGGTPPAARRGAAIAIDASTRRLAALEAYVGDGALPWHVLGAAPEDVVAWLRDASPEEVGCLVRREPRAADVRTRALFWLRLLALVPEADWSDIADGVAEALGGSAAALAAEVLGTERLPPGVRAARLALAAAALAAWPGVDDAESARIARAAGRGRGPLSLGAEEARPGPPAGGGTAAKFAPGGALRRSPSERAEAVETSSARADPSVGAARDGERSIARPAAGERRGATGPAPLAVDDAGLVLLHPFLPRLFEATGLVRPGTPGLAPTALPRAAALLRFLATRSEDVFEFEIGLVRVLLGVEARAALPVASGLLGDADREEAAALLASVVAHWRALGRTSVAGLRSSFLRRRGLLRRADVGWRLQVERAPFDMLLENLPWGFGVVKLPWMPEPLFTEWPTR